jgi:hypothetical protein
MTIIFCSDYSPCCYTIVILYNIYTDLQYDSNPTMQFTIFILYAQISTVRMRANIVMAKYPMTTCLHMAARFILP